MIVIPDGKMSYQTIDSFKFETIEIFTTYQIQIPNNIKNIHKFSKLILKVTSATKQFFAQCWRMETSSRPSYGFIKMTV